MRLITLTFGLLLAATLAAPQLSFAAESTAVRAILIIASNEKAPADPKLAPYEATLQRNVPESSFRFVADGDAQIAGAKGRATLNLGRTHRLVLEGEAGGGPGIHLKIEWMNGRDLFIGGSYILEQGVPLMLGRRPSGNGPVPIVLVIAK